MSEHSYTVNNHVIAFIDILGSSAAIRDDVQGSLNVVHKAYENSINHFKDLFHDKDFFPAVKIFSDNIVVAMPYREERFKRSAFLAVAMMSAVIQVEFLKKGWLTRGGIAAGSFFADDIMVWGSALVEAYKIESTIAVYPRIVIAPKLIGELKLAFRSRDFRCIEWIRQDKDRLFYVEYLNRCLKNANLFILGLFDIVEKQIAEHNGDTKVCQKWLWLGSYLKERLPEVANQGGESTDA